ncbi:MAG: hypothetical protein IPP25_06845 [Saprospiraceae bacterium]|nr:hypothetical protein [Candidatus Opimibacter skivensis]
MKHTINVPRKVVTEKGDAARQCPVCGTDLVHNQAYHAQAVGILVHHQPTRYRVNPTGGTPATATPPAPPSAQNAKGELPLLVRQRPSRSSYCRNCASVVSL